MFFSMFILGLPQGLAYSAIGKFAQRAPNLFHDNIDLLQRYFVAVLHKDLKLRAHVLEALYFMRIAFRNPSSGGMFLVSLCNGV